MLKTRMISSSNFLSTINPFIHDPSIYPSIDPPTHPSIYSSTLPSIYPSTHPFIHPPIHPLIHPRDKTHRICLLDNLRLHGETVLDDPDKVHGVAAVHLPELVGTFLELQLDQEDLVVAQLLRLFLHHLDELLTELDRVLLVLRVVFVQVGPGGAGKELTYVMVD